MPGRMRMGLPPSWRNILYKLLLGPAVDISSCSRTSLFRTATSAILRLHSLCLCGDMHEVSLSALKSAASAVPMTGLARES